MNKEQENDFLDEVDSFAIERKSARLSDYFFVALFTLLTFSFWLAVYSFFPKFFSLMSAEPTL